jgi:hypothetical protein
LPLLAAVLDAAARFPRERGGVILTTPGHFEAHGIWFPRRELEVV